MHDRTRRLLCRTVFLTFCVAPTLFATGWICVVRSPVYVAYQKTSWERTLSDQLGLIVSIDNVDHPVRGVTALEGVELADPETRELVARVRQIEIGQNKDEWVLLASQPVIQGDRVWHFWEVLHDRLLRGHRSSDLRAQLVAGEVTIRRAEGDAASTLTGVRCRLAPTAEGPQATLEFRDVAFEMAEPAQLRVTRNRQVSPPATRWELHTGTTAFPCSMLAEQIEVLASLGDEATFQGTVQAMSTANGWEGEITGRFSQVDLDRVVTNRFDHKLSGTAEIVLQRAAFAGGRLVDAAGDMACEGGVVSWSLLDQAHESLGLVADARVRSVEANSLWRFHQLKFGFSLSREGINIMGHCDSAGQGVVMADENGPLLTDNPQEIVQVVALVRTLASKSVEQVPAAPEAYQLFHVLPIPSTRSEPEVATPRPIHSPLRLRPVPH
ncbi:MAG: hypothetical protein H8E44_32170 [Planctomycetes bacterium]|nr:hypothetical protein [Planctomycetota bacterium]MBL7042114.1 hypothetical protein [Pirellulaceae bacterium]